MLILFIGAASTSLSIAREVPTYLDDLDDKIRRVSVRISYDPQKISKSH